jgi:hypothetical protein
LTVSRLLRPRQLTISIERTGEIVGQNVQRHFGGDLRQRLHQEVGGAHPSLDGPERMLDRLAALAHGVRVGVEPLLHGFEHLLMLPPRNPSLRPGGTMRLERAISVDLAWLRRKGCLRPGYSGNLTWSRCGTQTGNIMNTGMTSQNGADENICSRANILIRLR